MRLVDLLYQGCLSSPVSPAVAWDRGVLTYEQLQSHVKTVGSSLTGTGCTGGVKVGLFFENSPEYLTAFFAVSDALGTIVPLARNMTAFELQSRITSAGISLIISDTAGCNELVNKGCMTTLLSMHYDENSNLHVRNVAQRDISMDNSNTDVGLIISTSGYTDSPKNVMLTNEQLVTNVRAYQSIMCFRQRQMVYCALPFYHIYSISAQILTHISQGDTLFISKPPFLIRDFFKTVQCKGITMSAFVPYYAVLMTQCSEWLSYDLKSLDSILLAGGKTSVETLCGLRTKFPSIRFINTYGLTEAGPRVTLAGPEPTDYPLGSVGKPLSGVSIKIVDDAGNQLPFCRTGQIVVKSPSIMKGYYAQPGLSKKCMCNGWLKTGDLGKCDELGNLYIEGRQKDVIISGGRNIYPYEIEECLLKHPLVSDVAVVSKPDSRLQEIPYAFVVTRANANIDYNDLVAHCRCYLSGYKVPFGFKVVERLPRISASKIDRRRLTDMLSRETIQ